MKIEKYALALILLALLLLKLFLLGEQTSRYWQNRRYRHWQEQQRHHWQLVLEEHPHDSRIWWYLAQLWQEDNQRLANFCRRQAKANAPWKKFTP